MSHSESRHCRPSHDDVPPEVWEALRHRYRREELLGGGGMGVVFRAYDLTLEREVALKFPKPEYVGDEILRERFQREARVNAKLQFDGVCRIYDYGEVGEFCYIAMEYVSGPSLVSLMLNADEESSGGKGAEFTEREILDLIFHVALTMDRVHQRGVIHRDLKPANILIDHETRLPVITDFGASRDLQKASQLTMENEQLGTLPYMSLEQMRGAAGEVGPYLDIYSLGVVLYQLLTGHLPFEGNQYEIIRGLLHEDPQPIEDSRPEVGPATASICMRMLAKRPEEGFASMADVAGALLGEETAQVEDTVPMEAGRRIQRLAQQIESPPPHDGIPAKGTEADTEPRATKAAPDRNKPRWVKRAALLLLILVVAVAVIWSLIPDPVTPPSSEHYFIGFAVSRLKDQPFEGLPIEGRPSAATDLSDLGAALQKYGGYRPLAVLTEGDATREAVMSGLKESVNKTKPGDTLVIAISTYHFLCEQTGRDDCVEGTVYAACYDSRADQPGTALAADELVTLLQRLEGRNILLVVDLVMDVPLVWPGKEALYHKYVQTVSPSLGPRLCLWSYGCRWENRGHDQPSAIKELTRWLTSGKGKDVSDLLDTASGIPHSALDPGWILFPQGADTDRVFDLFPDAG